ELMQKYSEQSPEEFIRYMRTKIEHLSPEQTGDLLTYLTADYATSNMIDEAAVAKLLSDFFALEMWWQWSTNKLHNMSYVFTGLYKFFEKHYSETKELLYTAAGTEDPRT